jgi:nucleoid-associated protein
MPLNHCILHRIERSSHAGDIALELKEQENSPSGPIFSLFEQLKHSFQRSAQKQFGHFGSAHESPLPGWIKEQHSEKISFVSFSQRLAEQIKIHLANTEDPFSAHLLIAQETIMEQATLHVFWVPHVEAIAVDSHLEVGTSRYIDTKKIHYAMRLQLDEWLSEESPKYLSIISSRGDKAFAEALSNSIGFSSGVDLVKDTKEFLAIVEQYAESLPEEKASETKAQVIDYCMEQDKRGEPVVIKELSSQLNDSAPFEFSSFVSDKQEQPSATINIDRGSLKRYVRFSGRDKNMSISFSSDRYGSDIEYDPASGRLILNAIPKSLKQQLTQHNQPDNSDTE